MCHTTLQTALAFRHGQGFRRDPLQRVVARLDGAIGYAPLAEIRPDMKVVRVDGKSPTDSGYSIDF